MKFKFLLLLFLSNTTMAQFYNRLIQFNVGISTEQLSFKSDIKNFNDSSANNFEFVSKSPYVSYTHTFIISNKIAISGRVGFQYLNIYYNNHYYGAPFLAVGISPALTLFYKKHFEYYVKLNAGASIWFNEPEPLTGVARRIFPEGTTAYTGITIGGFNYYVNSKLGFNLELSIWSPELVTFGINYRFYRGVKPTIQDMQAL